MRVHHHDGGAALFLDAARDEFLQSDIDGEVDLLTRLTVLTAQFADHPAEGVDLYLHPRMAGAARAAGAQVLTTSIQGPADLWTPTYRVEPGSLVFDMVGLGMEHEGLRAPLTGVHNLSNLLQALACARWLGADGDRLAEDVARIEGAPGRMERVALPASAPKVWVDYAHTPEALEVALESLRPVQAGSQLYVVFGCGGDRDPGKRALMGEVAARHADHVIITSDNPRGEDPVQIAAQVLAGVHGVHGIDAAEVHVELDRRDAIDLCLRIAQPQDLVLIAGKGHETTQTFADRVVPFDDRQVVQESFA